MMGLVEHRDMVSGDSEFERESSDKRSKRISDARE